MPMPHTFVNKPYHANKQRFYNTLSHTLGKRRQRGDFSRKRQLNATFYNRRQRKCCIFARYPNTKRQSIPCPRGRWQICGSPHNSNQRQPHNPYGRRQPCRMRILQPQQHQSRSKLCNLIQKHQTKPQYLSPQICSINMASIATHQKVSFGNISKN